MSRKELCLTIKHTGRSNMLYTPCAISVPTQMGGKPQLVQLNCLWDTGASGTVITDNVIQALGLVATGATLTNTASATGVQTNTYQIDLYLNTTLVFRNITVTRGVIMPGLDCLLGMDIIGEGDLSITNYQGNTCLSFRSPSLHEIDYYHNPAYVSQAVAPTTKAQTGSQGLKLKQAINSRPPQGRNELCQCNSGKKYKHCHGANNK